MIYLLVLLLCGSAAVVVIIGPTRRNALETAGLVIMLGAGVLGTVLMWLSMLGVKPSRISIILLGISALLCMILSGITRGWPRLTLPVLRRPVRSDLAMAMPLALIMAAILLATMVALRFDLFEGDSISIWGFKAKVLFLEALRPKPAIFIDPLFSYTHQDYPLLLPMLTAAAYAMVGQVNEPAGKVVLPLLFLAQAALGFVAVRQWLSPARSLFVTALLICLPFGVFFAGVGNPDAVFTTFYLGALIYLVRWIEGSYGADLVLSSIFCSLLAITKQEGLPLALFQMSSLSLFILIHRNRSRFWKDFGLGLAVLAIVTGSWWIWRSDLPHTIRIYESRFRVSVVIENIGRLGIIIPTLARRAIGLYHWGVFWLLIPLAAAAGHKAFSKPQLWMLWILFLLHITLYVIAYVVADWDVVRLLAVSSDRLMLHVAPAGMLLIALHWSAVRPIHLTKE